MARKNESAAAAAPAPAAPSEPTAPAPASTLPFVPKIVKTVVRPTLKLVVGDPIYVKIVSPIYTGKEIKSKDGGEARKPAQIVDIVDLRTGEDMQMVCGAVVVSSLTEAYPDDGYVGKCFMLQKNPKSEGKSYFTYKVLEIADPTA